MTVSVQQQRDYNGKIIEYHFRSMLSKFNQLSMVAGDVLSKTADEEESKTDFEKSDYQSGTFAEQYFDTTITEQYQRCHRNSLNVPCELLSTSTSISV